MSPRRGKDGDITEPQHLAELEASKQAANYYGDTTWCVECRSALQWGRFEDGTYGYVDQWANDICPDEEGAYWRHEPALNLTTIIDAAKKGITDGQE